MTRSGNKVQVYTTWLPDDIIFDGRDATDVAGAVCSDVLGDLGETAITALVWATDGSILADC